MEREGWWCLLNLLLLSWCFMSTESVRLVRDGDRVCVCVCVEGGGRVEMISLSKRSAF